jgi:cytochrome c-type biogenesis protein CcmF
LSLAIILTWAGVPSFYTILSYSLSLLIIMAIGSEYHQTGKHFQLTKNISYPQGVVAGWRAHRRKSAGYLVHIGVAVVAIGITASMSGKVEKEFSLAIGESFQVGEYQLELNELKEINKSNYIGLQGLVTAYRPGMDFYAVLEPELRRYNRNGESTTEVALKMGLKNDLYLILAGLNETGDRASFKVYINPLQVWLWFGVLIMLLGTLIIVTDKKLAIHD